MSGPAIGRLVAYVTLSVVVALMVIAVVVNLNTGRPQATGPAPPPPPSFHDAEALVAPPTLDAGDPAGFVQEISEIRFEGVGDDGDLLYEILADRLDPQGQGRMRLEAPEAVVHLDGYLMKLRAREGWLVKPGDGPPERGRLEGSVEIELLSEDEGVSLGTLRTERIRFETSLGEVEAPDPLEVTGEGVEFAGAGLLIRVAELEEGRYGLSYLRVERTDRLRVLPSALASRAERVGADEGDPGDEPDEPDAGSGSPGLEQVLSAEIERGVEIRQGPRWLRAERIEAVARLIDGALAPGAIAPIRFEPASVAAGPEPETEPVEAEAEDGASRLTGAWIEATWAGVLEARAVGEAPPLMGERDLAVIALESPGGRMVEARDDALGVGLRAAGVRYGLTTGRLALTGVGSGRGVYLGVDGLGSLDGERVELDLGSSPLVTGAVVGPGQLRATADDAGVIWAERADFEATLERLADGGSGVRPAWASAGGELEVWSGDRIVRGPFGRVWMRRTPAGEDEPARVIVRGGVEAGAGAEGATLAAEDVEVIFAEAGRPQRAEAVGDVRVAQGERRLSSGRATVRFDADESGEARAREVEAVDGVVVEAENGLRILSPTARADLVDEVVELVGDGTEARRVEGVREYTLGAGSLRLETGPGRLTVFGPGWLEYDEGEEHGRLSWQGGLVYDDASGRADAHGRVIGERTVGTLERQSLEAEDVLVLVTPRDSGDERTLRSIEAQGEPGRDATVEARWYRDAGGALERTRLVALRSGTIRVDSAAESISAPGPGVLVVDETGSDGAATPGATWSDGLASGGAGTTGLWWTGSMEVDRAAGVATLREGVRVTHLPLGAEEADRLDMDCERLSARFTESGGEPELVSIESVGAVYVSRGRSEVVCDEARFEAGEGRIVGIAAPGNVVTVLDGESGRHVTATRVELDVDTGAWSAERARGIPQPR
jgi:hypothetical protein